jgi:hypothetical protein
VSWHGTIAQYAGRLHRLYDGKREVRIYDYADLNVPMLARMFDRRCRGYEAVGYSISLPASAVPGWPADVVLPSDPEWKRDYAATVRRLIRDGVDTPLANLFVRAVKPSLPEAKGVERARSASEAFLFRRLETLPETKGRFQLNVLVPIAFDGQSQMEVDFLDEPLRIVLELDGSQHLSDPQGLPARSPERPAVAAERLSHPAFSCRRYRQGSRWSSGFHTAVFDRTRTVEVAHQVLKNALEMFVDIQGAVENPEDVDSFLVSNQVSNPVVSVQKNADVLFRILGVPLAKFRELAKVLNPIVDSENNLPCRLFVVRSDVVIDFLEPGFCFVGPFYFRHCSICCFISLLLIVRPDSESSKPR